MSRFCNVRMTPASSRDRATGLLGFLSLVLEPGIRIDGITLRRTRAGRLVLSFPERTARDGRRHPIVHPVDDATRRALEREVFEALGLHPLEGER